MKRLALLSLALVAACGGSSKHSSGSTQAALTTAGAATTATPPTTPTQTATSQTTTTAAGPPICQAANLALSFLGGQGATGHGLLGFALKNTSGSTCSTIGFPGILFLDGSGKPLPTQATRTTQDFFGSAPKVALTVAPGATVSFRVGVTHVPTGSAACTTAAALQVIPPNNTATLRITIPGGVFECETATVSPVRPGTTAYP